MGISNLSFSATNINVGLDADKSATPREGDMYLTTDTEFLYKCFVDGSWVSDELTEAKIDVAKPNIGRSVKGSYTGNGSNNRAIPHLCGVIPILITVTEDSAAERYLFFIHPNGVIYSFNRTSGLLLNDNTAIDSTNFYVDGETSGANSNLKNYEWVAVY